MVKLNVPKRVTLPRTFGRTFFAWYKRIKRSELPPNTVMRRTYTQRAPPRGRRRRKAEQGHGIFDFVKKEKTKNRLVKSFPKRVLNMHQEFIIILPKELKIKH